MRDLVGFAVALAVTAAILHGLRPLARRIALTDRPSERKAHAGDVPLIGGLAMFCGFALAALALDASLVPYRALFAGAAVLVAVGVLDDLRELSSRARFAAQIAAAVLMAHWGGVVLEDLGALRAGGGLVVLGGWAVAFTVFATVGVINALNMIDGLDGLAGGLSLIALAGLAYVAGDAGRGPDFALLSLLAACVLAFLAFNVRLPGRAQALVFMGDAGSMFLGFAITWFFVSLSQGATRSMSPVIALWLLMVPLFDTVWLILKRLATGRWPTSADVEHLHHVLQMAGLGPRATVLVLWSVAGAGAAAGIAAHRAGVAESTMFYAFLALFALYCAGMALVWHTRRLLWWPIERRIGAPDRRAAAPDRRRLRDRRSMSHGPP